MSTRALQVECLLTPLYDYRNGAVCSAYTAYFYSAGTSTAKNVWTEKEKTNPYTSRTLGSDGTIQVYGDGVYKIVIKDGDGTAVYTWDNVKVQHPNVAVLSKSGTYTATVDDDYILVTTTAGNVTINLYAAANFTHPLCIKNIGANSVVIDPSGAELIEGASTFTISTEDASAWLFSNGSAWYVGNDIAASATTLESGCTVNAFANSGLHIFDTNASHDLIITPGSDLTADRIFTITTGDAARTITLGRDLSTETFVAGTSVTVNTNNSFLLQKDAAGTGTVNVIKANASNRVELGAAINTFQAHNGTYTIDFPTNGMAAAKFMLGNSSTILWMYLNTAPPGWKVTATGADTVLAVSGGAGLYNVNGGTAGGETWANLKGHTHTGPSHAHAFSLAAPNHTHTLPTTTSAASYDTGTPVAVVGGKLESSSAGSSTREQASATTGNPTATAVSGSITADGTGASGAQSTADVRPTASIGKLFQLDTP